MRSYFNTDKVYLHEYFQDYVTIAAMLGPKAKVLEVGVLNGESLRMWQSLFPQGAITGVDINEHAGFPDGVKKVIASQDDPKLAELGNFDLIIDDASHDGILTRKTFEILWPQVNPGGFYVIEDWFIGIEPWSDGNYDHEMLVTVQGLLKLLTKDSDVQTISYRYGMAILRKRA